MTQSTSVDGARNSYYDYRVPLSMVTFFVEGVLYALVHGTSTRGLMSTETAHPSARASLCTAIRHMFGDSDPALFVLCAPNMAPGCMAGVAAGVAADAAADAVMPPFSCSHDPRPDGV